MIAVKCQASVKVRFSTILTGVVLFLALSALCQSTKIKTAVCVENLPRKNKRKPLTPGKCGTCIHVYTVLDSTCMIKVPEHMCALANAIQHKHNYKGCKNQTWLQYNDHFICSTPVLRMQCFDGFSLSLQRHVSKGNTMQGTK